MTVDAVYGVEKDTLNPDIKLLGEGPRGSRCGACANLSGTHFPTEHGKVQTLYYCRVTGQPKRVTWPGCSMFQDAGLPTFPGAARQEGAA